MHSIPAAVAAAFALAAAIACVVPAPPGAGQGGSVAAGGGDYAGASDPGGGHAADGDLCSRACERFVACNLDQMEGCLQYCNSGAVSTERLEMFAGSSCEDLQSYMTHGAPAGQTGQGCVTRGVNDCPHFQTCCGGDEATGTPGQCIDVAVCAGPRR